MKHSSFLIILLLTFSLTCSIQSLNNKMLMNLGSLAAGLALTQITHKCESCKDLATNYRRLINLIRARRNNEASNLAANNLTAINESYRKMAKENGCFLKRDAVFFVNSAGAILAFVSGMKIIDVL